MDKAKEKELQLSAARAVLPEGYAIVPTEPTQAMCEAGSRAWLDGAGAGASRQGATRYVKSVRRAFKAMLVTI